MGSKIFDLAIISSSFPDLAPSLNLTEVKPSWVKCALCSIRFKIKVLTTFICNKNQKNYTEILPRSKCLCIFNNQKIKSSWSLSLVSIGQNLFCFSVIHWINLILFHIHFHLNIRSKDKPAKKNGKNDHENYPERESKEQYDINCINSFSIVDALHCRCRHY